MSFIGKLRRRILTPDMSNTRLDVRGFHIKNEAAREVLETIGASFLTGYGHAAEARRAEDAEPHLEQIPVRYRGFAYEGAAMGFAVRDAFSAGSSHVATFLSGRGYQHVYMAYIGVGWAMARVPRFRWHRLTAPDPLLRWLVLDGYGFHQAYFRTDRYVRQHFHERAFPWPGGDHSGYASRVIDQGIGRAIWFVGGGDPDRVLAMLKSFPEDRQPDMFSGSGLAATYAGGADADELQRFWNEAGKYRPQVAQGSAFAAGARVRAGLVVPHNELATQIFCAMSPVEATKLTDSALQGLDDAGGVPAYEIWRQRIADEFVSQGRN